jgi:hypothetical protein
MSFRSSATLADFNLNTPDKSEPLRTEGQGQHDLPSRNRQAAFQFVTLLSRAKRCGTKTAY